MIIYTVETGEYSDHTIHAFCTTIEKAKECAALVLARRVSDYGEEPNPLDEYRWPRVFANQADVCTSYLFHMDNPDLAAKRVKWCDRDEACR